MIVAACSKTPGCFACLYGIVLFFCRQGMSNTKGKPAMTTRKSVKRTDTGRVFNGRESYLDVYMYATEPCLAHEMTGDVHDLGADQQEGIPHSS